MARRGETRREEARRSEKRREEARTADKRENTEIFNDRKDGVNRFLPDIAIYSCKGTPFYFVKPYIEQSGFIHPPCKTLHSTAIYD